MIKKEEVARKFFLRERGRAGAEPIDEPGDADRDRSLGVVAQEEAGFGNIGASARHISFLFWELLDDSLFLQSDFQGCDEFVESGGGRFAEVKDVEIFSLVSDGTLDAGDDVIDVSIIAACVAVSEFRDRFASVDERREFMDREVGALAGSIDGEEAEADGSHSVEVRVIAAEVFAREFRGGVGAEGLRKGEGFRKRNGFGKPIDRGAGSKNEVSAVCAAGGFQEVEGAIDIGF